MTAIVLDPCRPPLVQTVGDTQQALDGLCGGPTAMLRFSTDKAALLYLPDGQARGLAKNRCYRGRWYYGRCLIVGFAGQAFRSLTAEQAARYRQKFAGAQVPYEEVRWPAW